MTPYDSSGLAHIRPLFVGPKAWEQAKRRRAIAETAPAWYEGLQRTHGRVPDAIHQSPSGEPFALYAALQGPRHALLVTAYAPNGTWSYASTNALGSAAVTPLAHDQRSHERSTLSAEREKMSMRSIRDAPAQTHCITTELTLHAAHRAASINQALAHLTADILSAGVFSDHFTHLASAKHQALLQPYSYYAAAILSPAQHAAFERWGTLPPSDALTRVCAKQYVPSALPRTQPWMHSSDDNRTEDSDLTDDETD